MASWTWMGDDTEKNSFWAIDMTGFFVFLRCHTR